MTINKDIDRDGPSGRVRDWLYHLRPYETIEWVDILRKDGRVEEVLTALAPIGVWREVNPREFMPDIYGIVEDDIRAARLKKFQHIIYYIAFPDRIEVFAVAHGARDSPAWQSRI